ncbi:hypothetical protein ACWDKQ_08300 [Saccharopolyspora sp. NPDC000995]
MPSGGRILVTGGVGSIESAAAVADRGYEVVLLGAFLPPTRGIEPGARHRVVHGGAREIEVVCELLDSANSALSLAEDGRWGVVGFRSAADAQLLCVVPASRSDTAA